jgi:hypothetical protein
MKKMIKKMLIIVSAMLIVVCAALPACAFGEHLCTLEYVDKCYDSSTGRLVEQYMCTDCKKNYWECSECGVKHTDEELLDESRDACLATYVKRAVDKKQQKKNHEIEKQNNGFFMIIFAACAVCSLAGVVYKLCTIVSCAMKKKSIAQSNYMWLAVLAVFAVLSIITTIYFYGAYAEAISALSALT